MVVGGEVVQSFVEVAVFPKPQEAEQFLTRLKAASDKKREPDPNSRTWTVFVEAHLLDAAGIRQFAEKRKSAPYPGTAVVFLNRGAVHACEEFGIEYPRSDAPVKIIPDLAVVRISQRYCSRNIFAGADPCK